MGELIITEEAGNPVTPGSGIWKLFFKADGMFIIDDTGAVIGPLGAGTGAFTPGGRLTLSSGVPVTNADVTGATNIYYTPYMHNQIQLWNGSTWATVTFSQITHALGTVTSGRPYDVFGFLSSGTLAIEKLAWLGTTTRATGISLQDGRYCKTGDKTRLYLGTFHTTSTTATEDSRVKRFVWNMYNRRPRSLHFTTGDTSWTYNTAAWRERNSATSRVEIVVGVLEDEISLRLVTSVTSAGAPWASVSIGEDSTTAPHADGHYQGGGTVAGWFPFCSTLDTVPSSGGYHYYAWLEWANAGSVTFSGGTGANPYRAGMNGSVLA